VKQFIRNVRAAKTIADERAVVQKESAAIRASFREESHDSNVRCVATIFHRSVPMFTVYQAQQCSQAPLSFHVGRTNAFWPDRVSEAAGIAPLCRQTLGLLGDYVAAR